MSRRLSPTKLKASTTVKIARPGRCPSTSTGSTACPRRPSRPTPASAAAHRARGTRGRRGARRRPRVERREHEHRARRSSAARPGRWRAGGSAEQARRGHVLGLAHREHEPAHDARVRWPATITSASTAFCRPGPSAAVTTIARMMAGKAKTRSRCASPCRRRARGSSRRSRRASRRSPTEHDEHERERQRQARAVVDAREDVAAELVRAERVRAARRRARWRVLRERIVRVRASGAKTAITIQSDRDARAR